MVMERAVMQIQRVFRGMLGRMKVGRMGRWVERRAGDRHGYRSGWASVTLTDMNNPCDSIYRSGGSTTV